jgi:tetratricopeptide (TPR) repeat protein
VGIHGAWPSVAQEPGAFWFAEPRVNLACAATHFNRGRELADLRRYNEAEVELKSALRLTPNSVPILYRLALTERQLNRPDGSAELLRKAIGLDSDNADAHYLLGQNLVKTDHLSGAIAEWKRAVEISSDLCPDRQSQRRGTGAPRRALDMIETARRQEWRPITYGGFSTFFKRPRTKVSSGNKSNAALERVNRLIHPAGALLLRASNSRYRA